MLKTNDPKIPFIVFQPEPRHEKKIPAFDTGSYPNPITAMPPKPANNMVGPLTTYGHTEVWEELLPYLALGWAPATTSGDKAMCALHALTEALNAHRIIDEGLDPTVIDLTFDEILELFKSAEYKARAKLIATEFSKSAEFPEGNAQIRDRALKEYSKMNCLNPEQLGIILEMINDDLRLNYRLGVITSAQDRTDGSGRNPPIAYLYDRPTGGGPVIWLYSYGNMTHWEAIVPDQPLTTRKTCDYNRWGFKQRAEAVVKRGLYRVIMDVDPISEEAATDSDPCQMGLEIGQFVTKQDAPDNQAWVPPSDEWFWGELPSLRILGPGGFQDLDVPLKPRMGPVHSMSVRKIDAVVPQGHLSGNPFPKSVPGADRLPTPEDEKPETPQTPSTKKEKAPKTSMLPTPAATLAPSSESKPDKPKTILMHTKAKTREEIKKGIKKMKKKTKKARPEPPSSESSEEEPVFQTGSGDRTRRQPSYSDPPGTLRMYFATTAQPIDDPTSRLLNCATNQLLLKVDHEDLAYPRMREVDLIEGYVAVENLERIRRPWGIQNIMPTRGHPDYDSRRYGELKVIARKKGIRPGGSTRAVKRNIMADKLEKDLEKADDRDILQIFKLRAAYRPKRADYDAALKKATNNCRYVLKVQDNEDGTCVVTNIDGYSAAIAASMLIEEPMHWGISVLKGTTFPTEVGPESPEPLYVPKDIDDTDGDDIDNGVKDEADGGLDGGLDGGFDGGLDGGLDDTKPDNKGAFDTDFGVKVPTPGKYDSSNVLSQCGIDGVTGALISLRNALQLVNLQIRYTWHKNNQAQATALSTTLERYIFEANKWMTEIEKQSSNMGAVPGFSPPGFPPPGFPEPGFPTPGFPDPPFPEVPNQSSFQKFLSRLIGPSTMVGAAVVMCALAKSMVKGASASTIPSSNIARDDLVPMVDYHLGSGMGQYLVADSSPSQSRKRSFEETELEEERPLARRVRFRV